MHESHSAITLETSAGDTMLLLNCLILEHSLDREAIGFAGEVDAGDA
jgi:hypothetical protein